MREYLGIDEEVLKEIAAGSAVSKA
jgi:hypothetical protein